MNILHKLISVVTSWIILISPSSYFIEGVVGQPSSFLPGLTQTQTDSTISKLLYRGLFKYDSQNQLIPDLAEKWEISEDGLVYTITLRENQKWNDGSTITSEDIIYTSFSSPILSGVATDRIDEKTVRFTLPNKFSPFLSLLTVGIMKTNTIEDRGQLNPISSGEYYVASINRSGPIIKDIVLLNKNREANIRKLVFRYYSNDAELETAAKLGEITGFVSHNEHDLSNFKNYIVSLDGVYYALFFNLENENLKELNVREKLRNSLPIGDLVSNYGEVVKGPISKSFFTDDTISWEYFDENLETEDLEFKFRITVPDVKTHIDLANKIKEIWEDKLKLDIELVIIPTDKFNAEVIEPRNFDILLYGQEIGRDPDRYIYWHSTQTKSPDLNFTGFSHVRADRALEEGRNNTDNTERRTHYHEFQVVFDEQIPAILLYHPFINYYISDYYTGINFDSIFTLSDRFSVISNWKKSNTN